MKKSYIYSTLASDPDFGELVDMFVQDIPDRISTLETQAQNSDWQQLTRTAHQLKGSAGSYGFAAITPYAARLESAAKEGQEEEEILASLGELLDICRRVRAGLPQAGADEDSSIGSDFQ